MSIDRQKITDAAQKFAAKGQYDKALAEYARVIREDPSDVRVMLKIGDLQVRMNAHPAAIETYSQVARAYETQQDFRKAVAVYKQILQIDPNQGQLHLTLAELFVKLGLPAEAMQHFEVLAQRLARTQDTDTLRSLYQRMVQVDGNNVAVHIRLAELLSRLGKPTEAITEFETGCRLLQAAGRMDDWARVAERLFFHRPNDAGLARQLAAYYLDRNDAKRALPRLQVAYKANSRDVETLELLAQAFRALGQLPKTVSVLKEVARIHHDAGRSRERAEVYQRVLELVPTDTEAREALKAGSRVGRKPSSVPPPAHPVSAPALPAASAPPTVISSSAVLQAPPLPAAAQAVDPGDEVVVVEEDEVVFDLKPSVPPADSQPGVRAPVTSRVATPGTAIPAVGPQRTLSSPGIPPVSSVGPVTSPGGAASTTAVGPASVGGVGSARPSVGGAPAEITRLLGEADIFLKYGLKAKAVSHLNRAAQLDPGSVDIQVRLRDLFGGLSDTAGMVRASVSIARLLESVDPDNAVAEAARALELDPAHVEAREIYDRLTGAGGGYTSPEQAPEETLIDEGEVMVAEALPSEPPAADFSDETRADFVSPAMAMGPYGFEDVTERGASLTEPGEAGERHDANSITHTDVGGVNALRREIEEGLDEAEFFVTQGLYDDARDTLHQLLTLYPQHPLVIERWEEVEQLIEAQASNAGEDRSFALAEKLAEEVEGLTAEQPQPSGQIDVETVFAQFKQEIGRTVSVEDCDTHYDLGIAYKEMGLYDDAVAEFKIATMNPARQCIGETMIGLCYEEKGDFQAAVEHFKRGLQAPQRTEREELGLYYEIGAAYEHLGDLSEALYFYQKVDKRDPGFRNVNQRVVLLQNHLAGRPSVGTPGIEDVDRAFDELLKG